jgi:hypothetical protein
VDLPVRPVVAVNEQQLLAAVVEQLAGQRQLVWHHCSASFRCAGPGGLPDLVIAGPGGLVFAELKSAAGELSAGQQAWQWALHTASSRTPFRLWRPADWADGRIQSELALLSGKG